MLDYLPYIMLGASGVVTSHPLFFAIFFVANFVLNNFIKNKIKQPRPKGCDSFLKHSYGMPSQHSQTAGFVTAFVWPEIPQNQQMLLLALTFIVMAQRVWTQCHTVAQVIAGSVLGFILGTTAYHSTLYLKRKLVT